MSASEKKMPAWLVCYDLFTRIKDELILEAIDILHEQMEAKNIDIQGYVSVLQDKSQEVQRDMYIINNLLLREREIREQYQSYINGSAGDRNPDVVLRVEQLKKFMLAVDAISMLMNLSKRFEEWTEDTGNFHESRDIAEVIVKSMLLDSGRKPMLEYVLASRRFRKSDAIKADELKLLEKVLK